MQNLQQTAAHGAVLLLKILRRGIRASDKETMAAVFLVALASQCVDERSPRTTLDRQEITHCLSATMRRGVLFYCAASRSLCKTKSRGRLAKNHPALGPLSFPKKIW